jgi:hypothetical protein
LVEHWLFGLGVCLIRSSTPACAGGTAVRGGAGPGTLLGPEGSAALPGSPSLRAGSSAW